ncbi:MAG: S9 family peptidase [Candidatus Neomarinimicrobiota bacterium]
MKQICNRRRLFELSIFTLLLGSWTCAPVPQTGPGTDADSVPTLNPPQAEIRPYAMTLFGDTRIDNYYWMKERGSAAVLDYLNAENAYTDARMQPTAALQEELYLEMRGRIQETDLTVPVKIGNYYYYERTEAGQQYSLYCRRVGGPDGPEEILLDENALAEGLDYLKIGDFRVSPDHRYLAYSIDNSGGEQFTVFIKDLENGTLFPEQIPGAYYSLEWANDNRTIFYTTLDEAMRSYRVFRHLVGTNPTEDSLVYQEDDEAYFVQIGKSKNQAYLFLELESQVTTEVRYLAAGDPTGQFQVLQPRQFRVEYSVEQHGDRFFILTNEAALNFKLLTTPVADPARENWEELIAHRAGCTLEEITVFRNHLVVIERELGLRRVRVINLSGTDDYQIDFPEATYKLKLEENPDFDTDLLRFTYSSLVIPESVYDYNLVTRERELKKQDEVLGGYDPANYVTARIFATAPDSTQIPISIVYKAGMIRDGSNPVYLYGYGSYGINIDPVFRAYRYSLIDRGYIYAIAHVRGSSYLGREWYEDGKLLNKRNTFTDFIACAEHLIDEKYTVPEKLAIAGGSAGGLLIGVAINLRPELFGVAVADVPFVDVVTTMLDESIPLTVIEFDEWGNPNLEEYYHYMKSYSPYDNVAARAYPNLLVTAGLNDPRVQYWEPAKWVAKLRAVGGGDKTLLFKTNMDAGHHGASGRFDFLREIAFEYAFVLDQSGR